MKGAGILCLSLLPLLQIVPPAVQQKPAPPAAPPSKTAAPTAPELFPLAVMWRHTLDAPPAAPAGFDDHLAYVPLRTGQIVAVLLTTGAPSWSAHVASKFAPVTGSDLVFVATAEGVAALASADGATRWRVDTGSPPSGSPYFDAGRLVVGTESGDILAIDAEDGRTLWRRPLGSPLKGCPTFAPDRLLVSLGDGRVVALKPTSGETLWQQKLDGTPGDLVTVDARVYVGSKDGFLYCLSVADGRIRWRWKTGGAIIGRPIVDDRLVYSVSMDNQLRALDRSSGVQRWKTTLPARASAGLCLLDGRILAAGDGSFDAFQRRDGKAAGRYTAPADQILMGLPHVSRGLKELDTKIFFVTGEGLISALGSAANAPAAGKTPAVTGRPGPGHDRSLP